MRSPWINSFCVVVAIALGSMCVRPGIAQGATLDREGPLWRLTLENEDVQKLKQGAALAELVVNLPPQVAAAVAVAIATIDIVNEVGGRKGVEITGVIGLSNIVILPKGKGAYGELKKVANVIDRLGAHWGGIIRGNLERIENLIKIPRPEDAIDRIIGKPRRKNTPGAMTADAQKVQDWERFMLISVTKSEDVPWDNKVALLFHTGYLNAKDGGKGPTYANRDWVKADEAWELIRHGDGTVSFKNKKGYYFFARGGGGSVCGADHNTIGDFEKFYLEFDDQGRAALKTFKKGLYVTAHP